MEDAVLHNLQKINPIYVFSLNLIFSQILNSTLAIYLCKGGAKEVCFQFTTKAASEVSSVVSSTFESHARDDAEATSC